jgi:hypothetical protein
MALAAVVSFVAITNNTTVTVNANPPKTAVQENLWKTEGRRMAMRKTAIKLRAPAMATGFQSMDLMRTPPNDQNNAARSRRTTFLFKRAGQVVVEGSRGALPHWRGRGAQG